MKLMPKNGRGTKWLEEYRNRLYFELYVAYLYARRGGKRGTFDEHKFEVFEFLNLYNLMETIVEKIFIPARGVAHIIYNPVIREIFAAAFRDRVVHHWVYNLIYDWWNQRFIRDSYSCREGKGTLDGIWRLQEQIQEVEEKYDERAWVIKLDIQGYFMSIDRKILYELAIKGLDEQFKDNYGVIYELAKFCLHEIIFDDPCKGVILRGWPRAWEKLPSSKSLLNQLPGIGIVIGNLTSQLLSNIYLNELDKYVTEELGWKYYGRYVDDFYIVVPESLVMRAWSDVEKIEIFLKKRLKLTLHPKKRSKQPVDRGIAFLGAIVYPTAIQPGKRLKKRTRKAFYDFVEGKASIETIISYVGHMRYMKHHKFLCKVCEDVGLPRMFWCQYEKPKKLDDSMLTKVGLVSDREKRAAERRRRWETAGCEHLDLNEFLEVGGVR